MQHVSGETHLTETSTLQITVIADIRRARAHTAVYNTAEFTNIYFI